MMTLDEFIASNPDPRELKRALAVKMRLEGMKHKQIQPILGVVSSFISHWEKCYREQGVPGLRLAYQGSRGYLSKTQRAAVVDWIQEKSQRGLWEVIDYIEQEYDVLYRSFDSYYALLKQAGMSWQKGQKKIPNKTNLWFMNAPSKSVIG
jgi:transposase